MDFICTCIHASDNVGFLAALTDKSEGLVLASEEKVSLIPKKSLFLFGNKLDKGNYVNQYSLDIIKLLNYKRSEIFVIKYQQNTSF